MLIIAERINSSRKSIARAISSQDKQYIQNEARIQDQAGADFIDVNAGTFGDEEAGRLQWVIETVQEVSLKPLCLDSSDPAVIRAMIPLLKAAPMINSITLEPDRLKGILPIVAENKAKVIALCQSRDALAETAEEKLKFAQKLVEKATAAGVLLDDLYIDPLVYPLSVNQQSAVATLEAIGRIRAAFPGVHTLCGLSNVSHGLPCRKLVNRSFLVAAVTRGLDAVIMDPTDHQLVAALKAALMINGKDNYCLQFLSAYREGRLE